MSALASDHTETPVPADADRPVRIAKQVSRAAAVLIIVQTVYRGWLSSRGWFVGDDFAFIGRAQTMPLWSHDYLITDYNGHVMPGAFFIVHLFTSWWPFSFAPVVALNVVLQLATAVLFYRLLVMLFGARPGILLALGVYLFAPLTLPAFLWWAAALNQLPQQLAMVGALCLHVSYLRTGRTWRGWLGALAVAGGLLFSEKTLVVVVFIAALTVFYFGAGTPARRVLTAWRRHWPVWVAYLVVVIPYAAYYLTAVPTQARSGATSESVSELATNMIGHAVFPALLGGPWRWYSVSANAAVAHPTSVAVWASLIVAVAVISASILLAHRAVYAWILAGIYAAMVIGLLAASRGAVVGPIAGLEYRYSTDLGLIVALCGALAFLPLRGDFQRAEPQQLIRRSSATAALTHLRESVATPEKETSPAPAASPLLGPIAVVALLFVSALISNNGYERVWSDNLAKTYVQTARADIESHHGQLTIADVGVPDRVVWSLVTPGHMTSQLLGHSEPRPRFLQPGESSETLYIPDDGGHLRIAGVRGVNNAPGPNGACGWYVAADRTYVALAQPTYAWSWIVRIGYLASKNTTTDITVGDTTTHVAIRAGVHSLYVMGSGRFEDIAFAGLPTGTLCTNDVQVGVPIPIIGTHP